MYASCLGDARDRLSQVCMSLPEEGCLPGAIEAAEGDCEEDEFSCGDGQCVHGLLTCDNKLDCANGADELRW